MKVYHCILSSHQWTPVFERRNKADRLGEGRSGCIAQGWLRVVEIEDFDAQAGGRTHVHHRVKWAAFPVSVPATKAKNRHLYVRLG